ncbi:MAG TPA: MurR/RpiR family transcriptional regulator, partial [Lactobacillus sp.]|nr:MurR/RpiR family transcriptional regulator [Lactobacillus sp.]
MAYADIMHKHYNELTKSEKKVADYVLSVGQKVIYATMTDIKKATHVGDATIVRFCQKLGYSGFTDFKIEIAKEDFPKTKPATSVHYYDHIAQHLSDAI